MIMKDPNCQFPLTLISIQNGVNCLVAGIICKVWNLYIDGKILNWKLFKPLILIGMFTGFDYGLSNLSLIYITVTLYTMVKSIIPLIIMIISFTMGILKPKISLVISIILITLGISLAVMDSISGYWIGIVLLLGSALFAGIRLVGLQKVLQDQSDAPNVLVTDEDFGIVREEPAENSGEHHVSSLLVYFYVCGVMSITILPFAIVTEWGPLYTRLMQFQIEHATLVYAKTYFLGKLVAVSFLGGMIALFLNVFEFLVIQNTSSLTLSVIGIIKEMIIIACGVILFGDHLTWINAIGYCICLVGIVLYKVDRYKALHDTKMDEKERRTRTLLQSDDDDDIQLENDSLIMYEREALEKQEKEEMLQRESSSEETT